MTMQIALIALLVIAISAVVGLIIQLTNERRAHGQLKISAGDSASKEMELRRELDAAREAETKLSTKLETALEAKEEMDQALEKTLERTKELMREEMKNISNEALRRNAEQLARESKEKLDLTLKPVTDHLKKMDESVKALETKREGAYKTLEGHVEQMMKVSADVGATTGRLANALYRPTVRGQMGEMLLVNALEMAGMTAKVDFDEQVSIWTGSANQRPDVMVNLPNGKKLIIDSKVALDAFMAAQDAETEEERVGQLKKHAKAVRTHIDQLSTKAYQSQFSAAPEFVVMYIPSEALYYAALQHDRDLVTHAASKKVVLASPMSLVGLLHVVAQGWADVRLAEEAIKIRDEGRTLYTRLEVFTRHYNKVGQRLRQATDAYNDSVGSSRSNLMPSVARLSEMKCEGPKAVVAPETVDVAALVDESPEPLAEGDGSAGLLPSAGRSGLTDKPLPANDSAPGRNHTTT